MSRNQIAVPPRYAYKFGDTQLAADRLITLAETFADSSRIFIENSIHSPVRLAVDLGCGTGHSSHLLAEATGAELVVGFDNSPSFLELAQHTATPRVGFLSHDVTTGPFQVPPPDVIYSRFLMSHLRETERVLDLWSSQLAKGGRILVDEVEWVDTSDPMLDFYQEVVVALLSNNGQRLEIGSLLAALPSPPETVLVDSRVVTVTPTPCQVGRMFYLNMLVWGGDSFLRESFGEAALTRLKNQLHKLADGGLTAQATWGLRQIVIERKD